MPTLKPGTIIPNAAQDAAITAAALSDSDALPYTDAQWALVKPRAGRPPLATPKQAVKLRLDADLLACLRASGRGWQTRVNTLLKEGMQAGKFTVS
jgi:uncharacterized protein (DUF4415 family)